MIFLHSYPIISIQDIREHIIKYNKITYTRLACKVQCERTVHLTALTEEKKSCREN